MKKRFIRPKELAKYIDISINTIYFWIHTRQIPYYKIGNLVKFDISEIDEWLKAKKILPRYSG
jgi:excisionase family DNA binding protein